MMKITGLSHLFKWENLHNWWMTKYFFAPLYIYIYICVCICMYTSLHCHMIPKKLFITFKILMFKIVLILILFNQYFKVVMYANLN